MFSDGDVFSYTRHEPVGVCGQIIPVSTSYVPSLTILMSEDKQIMLMYCHFILKRGDGMGLKKKIDYVKPVIITK